MNEYGISDEKAKNRDRDEEMNGMRFRFVKIQFYPEDIEKMESMEHDEKMKFVMQLRKENRYVEVEDEDE